MFKSLALAVIKSEALPFILCPVVGVAIVTTGITLSGCIIGASVILGAVHLHCTMQD